MPPNQPPIDQASHIPVPWGFTPDAGWTNQAKALVGLSGLALVCFIGLAVVLVSEPTQTEAVASGPEEVRIALAPKPLPKPPAVTTNNGSARDHSNPPNTSDPAVNESPAIPTASPVPTPARQAVHPDLAVRRWGRPYGGQPLTIKDGTRLQVEHYNEGGPWVAYHDNTSEQTGNTKRQGQVDGGTTEGVDGERVGWTQNGEWLNYTVDLQSGTYDIDLRYAAGFEQSGRVQLLRTEDHQLKVVGVFDTKPTGEWSNWRTASLRNVQLPGGVQTLRISFINGGELDVDYLNFRLSGSSAPSPIPSSSGLVNSGPSAAPTPVVTLEIDPGEKPLELLGMPIRAKTAVLFLATDDMSGFYASLVDALSRQLNQRGDQSVAVYVRTGQEGQTVLAHPFATPGPGYGDALRTELRKIQPASRRGAWFVVNMARQSSPEEYIFVSSDRADAGWDFFLDRYQTLPEWQRTPVSVLHINVANASASARNLTVQTGGRYKTVPLSVLRREAGR